MGFPAACDCRPLARAQGFHRKRSLGLCRGSHSTWGETAGERSRLQRRPLFRQGRLRHGRRGCKDGGAVSMPQALRHCSARRRGLSATGPERRIRILRFSPLGQFGIRRLSQRSLPLWVAALRMCSRVPGSSGNIAQLVLRHSGDHRGGFRPGMLSLPLSGCRGRRSRVRCSTLRFL